MTAEITGRLPDWLVVGAMKSGTTTVAAWLGAHPDGWLVPHKEVHFFDQQLAHDRGAAWYRAQFSGAPAGALAGEGSPSYMFVTAAPARMHALVPDARLIACLRDPVRRAYSHYWQLRRLQQEHRSFEEALTAERDEPDRPSPGYLARGRYLPQLRRLLDHYPRESLLVVLTDDLEDRPDETFGALCRHVGLDDSVALDATEHRNIYHEYRAPRLYAAMFEHRLWRWIPPPLRAGVAARFRREAEYPPLDPHLAGRMRSWFDDDDQHLASWLGRELPWR